LHSAHAGAAAPASSQYGHAALPEEPPEEPPDSSEDPAVASSENAEEPLASAETGLHVCVYICDGPNIVCVCEREREREDARKYAFMASSNVASLFAANASEL
jgi:hypothetical protein